MAQGEGYRFAQVLQGRLASRRALCYRKRPYRSHNAPISAMPSTVCNQNWLKPCQAHIQPVGMRWASRTKAGLLKQRSALNADEIRWRRCRQATDNASEREQPMSVAGGLSVPLMISNAKVVVTHACELSQNFCECHILPQGLQLASVNSQVWNIHFKLIHPTRTLMTIISIRYVPAMTQFQSSMLLNLQRIGLYSGQQDAQGRQKHNLDMHEEHL